MLARRQLLAFGKLLNARLAVVGLLPVELKNTIKNRTVHAVVGQYMRSRGKGKGKSFSPAPLHKTLLLREESDAIQRAEAAERTERNDEALRNKPKWETITIPEDSVGWIIVSINHECFLCLSNFAASKR